jgi:SWI/SNF-related matrix-associated actin-dependent regulator 1 of chromatin subfamily A
VAQVRVIGRVISVRPRDEHFVVTLGPPPHMFWFVVESPPRLGQRIELKGARGDSSQLGAGELAGTMTQIREPVLTVIPEPYAVRVVPQAWVDRVVASMRRPLFGYQKEGAAWTASRIALSRGSLLCDDPGLGKTAQAIAALTATNAFPALVVCPASLKEQWAREFGWANPTPRVSVVNGSRGPMEHAEVHIMNYELLRYREQQLRALAPRCIVFDECQALKEPKPGPRHRAAIATRLSHQCGSVVGLTGTPVLNHPRELWRLLHIVDRRTWNDYDAFRERYCGVRRGRPRKDLKVGRAIRTAAGRVEQLDELQAKVAPYMLRRLKHQVLSDLPPKSRRSIMVRLADKDMAVYRKAEKDVVAWLRSLGLGMKALRASRAKAIVKLTMLRHIAALGKLRSVVPEYLARWFDRVAPEPLVIFGYHRDVMMGIYQICQRLRLRIAGIGGRERRDRRQAMVDAFQAGLADVFLAPIATAGVGLNLQRASEALFVERVFTPASLVQAEDRIWRLGSRRPVTITYLDAVGTVDEHMCELLGAKQALVTAAVDGIIDPDQESLWMVDALARRMRRV